MILSQFKPGANVSCPEESSIPGKLFLNAQGKAALVFFQPENGRFGKWCESKTEFVLSNLVGNWVGMSDIDFTFASEKSTGELVFSYSGKSKGKTVFQNGFLLKLRGESRRKVIPRYKS